MTAGAKVASGLDLSVFTPYRIVVLGRAMSQQLGAAYAGESLTIPEWRVLAVISQAPSVAARDVVAGTPMDKMAVSRAVASLEDKGLIERSPVADRRVSALCLSVEGRAVFERVAAIALDYEATLFGAFGEAERGAFFNGLSKLESAAKSAASADDKAQAAE